MSQFSRAMAVQRPKKAEKWTFWVFGVTFMAITQKPKEEFFSNFVCDLRLFFSIFGENFIKFSKLVLEKPDLAPRRITIYKPKRKRPTFNCKRPFQGPSVEFFRLSVPCSGLFGLRGPSGAKESRGPPTATRIVLNMTSKSSFYCDKVLLYIKSNRIKLVL